MAEDLEAPPVPPMWGAPPPPPPAQVKRKTWPKVLLGIAAFFVIMSTLGVIAGRGDEETLQALEADIADRDEEIADLEAKVEELRDNMAALSTQAAAAEDALRDAQTELDTREAELDAREAALVPAEAVAARSTFGDGTWLVGVDIEPGRYRTDGTGSFCLWQRLSGLGGTNEERTQQEAGEGPMVADILPTDMAFMSSTCGTWTRI